MQTEGSLPSPDHTPRELLPRDRTSSDVGKELFGLGFGELDLNDEDWGLQVSAFRDGWGFSLVAAHKMGFCRGMCRA